MKYPDKTIKLWKVFEKSLRVVSESNHFDGQRQLPAPSSPSKLKLPRMTPQENITAAVPRKVYSNAHAYHIHSISVNSDQETYISADDLRINLWNLNISDQSFSAWLSFIMVIYCWPFFRHCGYQTCQYGGVDGSHNRYWVPPGPLQPIYVLELKI